MSYELLSVAADAKTVKSIPFGYLTAILYMAPAGLAGGRTLCPFSTAGCRLVCLNTAGHGAMASVQEARIRKARWWLENPTGFLAQLVEDIKWFIDAAERRALTPAVRLNGTTDIEWEKYGIMEQFPELQLYDYSKYPPTQRRDLPPNYHLTFSLSESPHSLQWAAMWQRRHVNTAVVFRGALPPDFKIGTVRRKVINGDESDLRFTDPKGVIVGLTTKGKARKDAGVGPGFFVQQGL